MPTEQEHTGVYPAAFNVVSAFVWDRFEVRTACGARGACPAARPARRCR